MSPLPEFHPRSSDPVDSDREVDEQSSAEHADVELHKLRNDCQHHRNAYTLNALAGGLKRRGHLDEAKSLYNEALALQENHASRVGLAAAYCDSGLVEAWS